MVKCSHWIMRVDERWVFAAISFVISGVICSFSPMPNSDGVFYLRVAEKFLDGGLESAFEMYRSPYYSVAIGLLSREAGIELTASAYLLNSLACAAIAWFIADLGRLIGNGRIAATAAGALFLLHPQFNEYRSFIIRDFTYWALCLAFLGCQIRFILSGKAGYLLAGLVLLFAASLFRFESVFFVIVPFVTALLLRHHQRLLRTTLLCYVVLAALVFITGFCLLASGLLNVEMLLKPGEKFFMVSKTFLDSFSELANQFQVHMLRGYLDEYSEIATVAAFLVIVILKMLKSLSVPYFLLGVGCWRLGYIRGLPRDRCVPVAVMIVTGLLVVLIYTLSKRVVQGRYVLLFTLLILPVLAACVENWWLNKRSSGEQIGKGRYFLGLILVVYMAGDSFLSFGDKKTYILESTEWLKGSFSKTCSLASNSKKIGYFSGLHTSWHFTDQAVHRPEVLLHTKRVDVIAFEYRSKRQKSEFIQASLLKTFTKVRSFDANDRGVAIYTSKKIHSRCFRIDN